MTLIELFEEATERKASDIHLATGEAPCLRIEGDLVRLNHPALTRDALSDLLDPMLSGESRVRLAAGIPVERTAVHGGIAFVAIMFRTAEEGLAATFRMLSNDIPALEFVGGHATELFKEIANAPRGLVLITGPTGSGKWTTACALIERINIERKARQFVVVAHPGYRFTSKSSMITQLHIGEDCDSYLRAMEIAHEADLDVLAVDDIPTPEALRQILMLADTGHLVIANLHAENVADALRRLCDLPGVDVNALRRSLAQNLFVVTSQRLFSREKVRGRVAAYESIRATPEIREAIVSGDFDRLQQIQEADPNCVSKNEALNCLVESGEILETTAALFR